MIRFVKTTTVLLSMPGKYILTFSAISFGVLPDKIEMPVFSCIWVENDFMFAMIASGFAASVLILGATSVMLR